MKKVLFLAIFILSHKVFSQKDSTFMVKNPLLLNFSPLFSPKHLGTQFGIWKLQNQKEIRKRNKKIVLNQRFLGLDLGFYSQKDLHNSLFLYNSFVFRRVNPYGFYRQIRPFLGIAQTFLNEESYSVNDKNEVVLNKLTGNFYLTGGMGFDFGKAFSTEKSKYLRDIRAGILMQTYYPNFRFIAIKPAFQFGTSFNFAHFSSNFKKKIIVRK